MQFSVLAYILQYGLPSSCSHSKSIDDDLSLVCVPDKELVELCPSVEPVQFKIVYIFEVFETGVHLI